MFEEIDENGDGGITLEEAVKYFSKRGYLTKVIKDAFFEVDSDLNGTLDFSEFQGKWESVLRLSDRFAIELSAASLKLFISNNQ